MTSTLSSGDIMLAIGLIFGIAMACQAVAPLLRIPALILLLPAGFVLGLAAPQVQMSAVLGPAFSSIVDLIVALILFQGGMRLGAIKLQGSDRRVVHRLIWIGAPVTWVAGTLALHFIVGMSWQLATLLGAILIVSGPTVVTPILDAIHLKPRVRGILMWEGTMLDPIGAILAVVVFQVVRVSGLDTLDAVGAFFESVIVAVVVGTLGIAVAAFGAKLVKGNPVLTTEVVMGSVLLTAGLASYIAESSGLMAALLMGIAANPLSRRMNTSLEPMLPFFDTIASVGTGVLFISITALVPSPEVVSLLVPSLIVAALLVVVVRPLVGLSCTLRSSLTLRERLFIGSLSPRGIVAAATASSVGAALVVAKVPGADELLPVAFIIIAATVTVYGLGAGFLARALGLADPTTPSADRVLSSDHRA